MTTAYVPAALSLSLAIFAEQQRQRGANLEFATYVVVDKAIDLAGWSEDRRADLYARIVTAMAELDHSRFLHVQAAVTKALKEHNATWQTRS